MNAVQVLGQIGEAAVPALISLLQDPEVHVRTSAARALVQIGTPEAVKATMEILPALILLLQDPNEDVRRNVAQVLRQIGTPEALKAVN